MGWRHSLWPNTEVSVNHNARSPSHTGPPPSNFCRYCMVACSFPGGPVCLYLLRGIFLDCDLVLSAACLVVHAARTSGIKWLAALRGALCGVKAFQKNGGWCRFASVPAGCKVPSWIQTPAAKLPEWSTKKLPTCTEESSDVIRKSSKIKTFLLMGRLRWAKVIKKMTSISHSCRNLL